MFVLHYNLHPEKADLAPKFGKQVVVIGVGNVMLDIVHYLKMENMTRTVTAVARRGPTEVKFDQTDPGTCGFLPGYARHPGSCA